VKEEGFITRRRGLFALGGCVGLTMCAPAVTSRHGEAASMQSANNLEVTAHINHDHPGIMAAARPILAQHTHPRDRALACFVLVRDQIKFGFSAGFWDVKASDVLARGIGFCNNKSTLFVALARACGLQARQVFVDINADVLGGLLNPGTPYVDHSYAEIWIEGAWRATDAYIVDPPMFAAAQKRLNATGGLMGFGVHATGVNTWDGLVPTFSQFNINDPRPIGTRVWGPYRDVADFYARADRPWNKLNGVMRAGVGLLAAGANAKAEALRRG
jgi:transglutaminase-like putative cysteine protease